MRGQGLGKQRRLFVAVAIMALAPARCLWMEEEDPALHGGVRPP